MTQEGLRRHRSDVQSSFFIPPQISENRVLKKTKMRLMGATMLAGFVAFAAPAARAASTATVPGNVAGWVANATKTGTADDSRQVTIAVHMTLRNLDGLKSLVADVSKPSSPHYGEYLSTAAFRMRFAPDDADVAAVKELLAQAGMTNVTVGAANSYVSAVATVAQLRQTFSITQDTYSYGAMSLRANRELPTIPASLAGKIINIEGLDDTTFLKRPQHHSAVQGELKAPMGAQAELSPLATTGGMVTPPPVAANLPSNYCDTYFGDLDAVLSKKPDIYGKKVPWLICGYTPQQIQSAYGFDHVHVDGTGVTVAILDAYASPTLKDDGNSYAANHKLPPLTDANYSATYPQGEHDIPESDTLGCGGEYGWWGEESLDLAAVHGSAPGATIHYIGAADCGTSLTTALTDAIYNHVADVMTNSYSYNGEGTSAAQNASNDQSFMAADAEGITVLFSSGDDGDLSQLNDVATGAQEGDSPYVTSVGGTSLGLVNANGRKYEFGWGNYRDYLGDATVNSGTSITTSGLETTSLDGYTFDAFVFYAGAGGGISPSEAQPDYQAGIVPDALATTLNFAYASPIALSQKQRVAPDVSMVADPYTGYLYGETFTIAGDPVSDAGCTQTAPKKEYCEAAIGGTSLASPLMAGVIAVVDQQRMRTHKAMVGFANPWFYGAKIGTDAALRSAGINDIVAPPTPFSLLRGYANSNTRVRLITLDSTPFLLTTNPFATDLACGAAECLGLNDLFNYVTAGYDDVTGLGVPYMPYLINQ